MKNRTIPGEMALGTAVRSASGLSKFVDYIKAGILLDSRL